jgi:hypothetical protein
MADDDDDLRFGDVGSSQREQPEGAPMEGLPDSMARLIQIAVMAFVLIVVLWTLGQTMLDILLLL